MEVEAVWSPLPVVAWWRWLGYLLTEVLRRSYGNGPPPLPARADDTAPRMPVTAENVAMTTDRNFLNGRFFMPGSFQARTRTPRGSVYSNGASVNYC